MDIFQFKIVKGSIETWALYKPKERRNIGIYAIGIVFYRFGLEVFNGSIITLAVDRFSPEHTFETLGALTGLNQTMQFFGAILIGPMVKFASTQTVLAIAVLIFGVMTSIPLIVDRLTGGNIKNPNDTEPRYGNYNVDILFPVFALSGLFHGMVELLRRVIRRDLVGGHLFKMQQLDTFFHIVYEVAGAIGAFNSVLLILRFGNNYSFMFTPIMFVVAAFCWLFISLPSLKDTEASNSSYIKSVGASAVLLLRSVLKGAKMVLTKRKFVWFWGGNAVALYAHRFLEMTIAPAVAKRVFQTSAFFQIFVGMSHIGVILGVSSMFLLDIVRTPLPWLRMGALVLPLVWIIPFDDSPPGRLDFAWSLSLIFLPISLGWAAGDLSLIRFIQTLSAKEKVQDEISVLGAVMSFLYASYIVIYNILSIVLGRYIDRVFAEDGGIKRALLTIGGIQFSAISIFLLLNTLIPRGAFYFNPSMLSGESTKDQALHIPTWPQYTPLILMDGFRASADPTTRGSDQNIVGQLRYE